MDTSILLISIFFIEIGSSHAAKLRPEDVLRTYPKDVLWMSSYGPVCNIKGRPNTNVLRTPYTDVLKTLKYDPLRTTPYYSICNINGRPLLTSWGRLLQTLHDVPIRSNMQLQDTCPSSDLMTSLRDAPSTFYSCPLMVL